MKLLRNVDPFAPACEAHRGIEDGNVDAALRYVSAFAAGDRDIHKYWLQRAQAVVIVHLARQGVR